MLIVSVIMVLFYVGLLGSFFGFSNLSKTVLSIETLAKEPNFIIGSGIVSMFVSALFAPFTAGFIHLNYLAHHNKPFGIENLFDFYKEPYYKQIFLSYLVIGGLTALITTVLSLLGYEKLNRSPLKKCTIVYKATSNYLGSFANCRDWNAIGDFYFVYWNYFYNTLFICDALCVVCASRRI
jgi:hypothetical protein